MRFDFWNLARSNPQDGDVLTYEKESNSLKLKTPTANASVGLLDSAELLNDVSFMTDSTFQTVAGLEINPPSVDQPVELELSGLAISHASVQGDASFHLVIWDVTVGGPTGPWPATPNALKALATIDYPATRWVSPPVCRALLPAGEPSHIYRAGVFVATAGDVTFHTLGGAGWLLTAKKL